MSLNHLSTNSSLTPDLDISVKTLDVDGTFVNPVRTTAQASWAGDSDNGTADRYPMLNGTAKYLMTGILEPGSTFVVPFDGFICKATFQKEISTREVLFNLSKAGLPNFFDVIVPTVNTALVVNAGGLPVSEGDILTMRTAGLSGSGLPGALSSTIYICTDDVFP